ncbi:hypothetical protein RM533_07490 [Croceicoccus sp. F390]|uniref:Cytochrome c domain-containing protein n=1 Tax=Croceicoccus esteveae TaxID=3075597 RepID=A0ABU2ZHF2_9SPHN|nr:c-type cytochrome [Croceicoccus sp. F390]MDT0576028.1 hypothetical protein [Croceicoccus sp. F390]
MQNLPILLLIAPLLAACSATPASRNEAPLAVAGRGSAVVQLSTPQMRGAEFAQAHCSGCHAIAAGQTSPNPDAPRFEAVVNTPGLSQASLASWLANSHNYPDVMNFAIAPAQLDDVAAYMLTLRSAHYRPPIQ